MARPDYEEMVAERLARRTATASSDWFPVFKARYGMQVAFEAVRDELGDGAVATQLLTCCTAVDPILVAGLEPVYSEISRATAAIDPERLEAPERLRAVVLQHTYGIIDGTTSRSLRRRAHDAGAVLVEDCAHCVGRMARAADGSPLADVSVHSFGVEKMLDSHFGGAVWVNPDSPFRGLVGALRRRLAALPRLSGRLDLLTRMYRTENRVLVHTPRALSAALRRALSGMGLFEPAVSESERAGRLQHRPYRPSPSVCSRVLTALDGLDASEDRHAAAVGVYRELLADAPGIETLPAAMDGPVQPLLRFPVLARDTRTADLVTDEVRAAGFYTTPWYRPELGPGVSDGDAYLLPGDRSRLGVCDDVVARVVTLPADIPEDGVRTVAEVVRGCVS